MSARTTPELRVRTRTTIRWTASDREPREPRAPERVRILDPLDAPRPRRLVRKRPALPPLPPAPTLPEPVFQVPKALDPDAYGEFDFDPLLRSS